MAEFLLLPVVKVHLLVVGGVEEGTRLQGHGQPGLIGTLGDADAGRGERETEKVRQG